MELPNNLQDWLIQLTKSAYGKEYKAGFEHGYEAYELNNEPIVQSLKESTEQCSRMQLEIMRLNNVIIELKNQLLIKQINKI